MRIVIIGGTAAGMSAAAKAKRLAPEDEVIVYEKGEVISFGACGLPYYIGGFFDDPQQMIARQKTDFEKKGIKIFLNQEATAVDPDRKEVTILDKKSGKENKVAYDRLMIASGARPLSLRALASEAANVFVCKTYDDGVKIRKFLEQKKPQKAVVIGGGFIGIEILEGLKHRGLETTLIELTDQVLGVSFDREMTELFEKELRQGGVDLHLSEKVLGYREEGGRAVAVKTDQGEYACDMVITATGVVPNTKFLPQSLERLENGALHVNRRGETNLENIYAAGDCASVYQRITGDDVYIPLATYANKMGRIVGENLAGVKNEYEGALGSTGVKVLSLEAGKTGLTAAECEKLDIPYKAVVIKDKNQTDYYPNQEDIWGKILYDPQTKVIIGAQIVGKNGALLRADVMAAAIAKKMTTDELGFLDLIYAPPFSRTWEFLNVLGNVAK